MKIRLEYNGTVFEYSRQPMPERRFKALCGLVAAGVYTCVCLMLGVTALCGFPGLLAGAGLSVAAVFFGMHMLFHSNKTRCVYTSSEPGAIVLPAFCVSS